MDIVSPPILRMRENGGHDIGALGSALFKQIARYGVEKVQLFILQVRGHAQFGIHPGLAFDQLQGQARLTDAGR
jgi:hypothetical protein